MWETLEREPAWSHQVSGTSCIKAMLGTNESHDSVGSFWKCMKLFNTPHDEVLLLHVDEPMCSMPGMLQPLAARSRWPPLLKCGKSSTQPFPTCRRSRSSSRSNLSAILPISCLYYRRHAESCSDFGVIGHDLRQDLLKETSASGTYRL